MKNVNITRKLFTLHSWLGLVNGVLLLFLGITGALLVYTTELDAWINKDILTVQPVGEKLGIDSLYKVVRAKHPTAIGTTIIRFPTGKNDCISFRVYEEDGTKPMRKWSEMFYMDLDPYTGRILREGSYSDIQGSFLMWASVFHWNLQLGNAGVLIVTIAGLLLFLNILTGIVIYRRYLFKVMIFRAPVKWNNWRTATSTIHRYIGVWCIVLNILIFYSGLQMTWGSLSKDYYQKPAPIQYNYKGYASIDKMMDEVQKIYPGFKVKYFFIPFSRMVVNGANLGHASEMGTIPGTPSIIPISSSHVDFDINTGKVVTKVNANEELAKKDVWDKFNFVAYSFHAGTFMGQFSRVLYVFVGLTPAMLALSGFMLWFRKTRLL